MSKNAIVLGRYKRRIVADRTESNVAIIAPTRRGKGVSVVNPTALSWTGSMVVNDTKYELWPITSGWRSLLGKVYRFAPTTPGVSCRLNPIGGIDPRLEASIAKVQSIAGALAEPYEVSGSSETAGHFRDHGETLLAGLILHGLTTGRGRSLGGINWMLNDPERPTEDLYEEMLKSSHPFVGMTARQQLDLADRERAGIVSSTRRFLRLWHDPVIQKLTDHHSFDYDDLRRGTVPVSLYLCVTLEERERLRGLFRLIVTQAMRQMVSSGLAPGHEVLMLLDEFPVLGKMRELEQSFSEVAGFGIRALIICQSIKQLWKIYGRDTPVIDQCDTRLVMTPNDLDSAKYWSGMTAETTVTSSTQGKDHSFANPVIYQERRESESETGRPLMTAGEIMQMPKGKMILFHSGMPPARLDMLQYYRQQPWQGRAHL